MSATIATRTPWGRVTVAFAAGVMCVFQLGLMAPMVPSIQSELNLTLPFVGAILSAITAVATILGALAGTVTTRIGLARSLKIGLFVMAVTAALGAVVDSGAGLLISRCLTGLGYIICMVAAPALIARMAIPRDQALALGIWSTFGPLGIALAEAGAQLLDLVGWRGMFWVDAAILGVVCAAASVLLRDPAQSAAAGKSRLAFWRLYAMRHPMLLTLAFIAFSFAFIVFAGLIPTYLAEVRAVPIAEAGRLTGLAQLAGIPGAIGTGWLVRRGWSPLYLAMVALIAPALVSVAIFDVASLPVEIVALAIAVLMGGITPAATYALIPRIWPDPDFFAPVNGLLTQLASLGVLIGAPIFAAWTDATGWAYGPILLTAFAVAGVGCLMGLRRAAMMPTH